MNKAELEAEVSKLRIENKILQETIVMMGDRTQVQYIPYHYPQPTYPTPIWSSGGIVSDTYCGGGSSLGAGAVDTHLLN